jgi:lysophospholipase L1-like esterase
MSLPRVALVGDSQAEALWPRVQKAMPEVEFVLSRFQRGWSEWSYKNDGTITQQLATAKPDLVVFELGGNNSFLTDAKYRPNVEWLLDAARNCGARTILWLGPAAATKEPFKSNKEWTRSYQSQFMPNQPGVIWYDDFPHTQSGHVDGVHFNGRVYDAWAPVLVGQIRNALQNQVPAVVTEQTGTNGKMVAVGFGVLFTGVLLAYGMKRLLRPTKRLTAG